MEQILLCYMRTAIPSRVTADIPGCTPFEDVLFVPCRRFTVVRGEMCVFSQTRVKAEALGGGLESEKGGLSKITNRLPGHEMSRNVHLFGDIL